MLSVDVDGACVFLIFFFFKQKTAYEMRISDWSSDVCSSDLDRLAAIGFRDPAGALRHIAALTTGLSRKASIQRHLMPIMIRWFAEGVDPDYGLLAFRRIRERLGDTQWFLRMLRDSSVAADRHPHLRSGLG